MAIPDFSVVVWLKKNENFTMRQSELLAAAQAKLTTDGVHPFLAQDLRNSFSAVSWRRIYRECLRQRNCLN